MRVTQRNAIILVVVLLGAALAWRVLRPTAAPVEVAVVASGPLRVTVEETGITRIQRHAEISAPVPGRLAESHLEVGDSVSPGMVVARLYPAALDPRALEEARASLEAARALRREAEVRVQQASVQRDEARRARRRAEALAPSGALSTKDIEQAAAEERIHEQEYDAAVARERAAAQEERRVRALLDDAGPSQPGSGAPVAVRAPAGGRVLRMFEQHDRVVPAGTALLEIGNPADLEVVADVLTRDAVEIQSGSPMLVQAGSGRELRARVKRVEPAAFTKVSPLGVEEQRVNVVGTFVTPPLGLGDHFGVDVSFVLWESVRALKVPGGALFPVDSGWGAFAVSRGRARLRRVEVGHRGVREVEVLSGLRAGDTVIVHPDNRMRDGVRVTPRE